MTRDAKILTFGCRLNSYESEIMRAHAAQAGLDDAVIVNSCAVTGEAGRQTRQAIRRARRGDRDARIIVTGCAAQIAPQSFADMPEVDVVLGNREKLRAESFAKIAATSPADETQVDAAAVMVSDIMAETVARPSAVTGLGGRMRAVVQVQNGCDHRCTFCTIPFGRGRSRSVPAADVIAQVRQVVESGYSEVVLTGVDMTAYGADFAQPMRLGDLVWQILEQVPELPRLRLSSIDSVEVDPALFEAVATHPRLMPHLHLSLQAGDDMILKRMKRRHARQDAIALCAALRARRPDIVFGADLISGFPTETEAMFENSLRLVEECGLTFLHVFPFSARPDTPAARMPQLPVAVRKQRAARLREAGAAAKQRYLDAQQGQILRVLMEDDRRGRAESFVEVMADRGQPAGSILDMRITGVDEDKLLGVVAA